MEWLAQRAGEASLDLRVGGVVCASVVPEQEAAISEVAKLLTGFEPIFLRPNLITKIKVLYQPPDSLGPDRLANVLGGLEEFQAPLIIVDFGTATTLDVCSEEGFLGGAILPGVRLQLESLSKGTSKLKEVEARVPPVAMASPPASALQSGVVLGQVSAVEGLVHRMQKELSKPATVLKMGLPHLFIGATESTTISCHSNPAGHFDPAESSRAPRNHRTRSVEMSSVSRSPTGRRAFCEP